jgi:beta-lactamase superfamily II metal-dependent hydrolase
VAALGKLEKDWKKKAKPTDAETAAYVDQSVYNLSSLVFVVEAKGTAGKSARMLLTGDARGDHVIAGLEAGGFLKGGKAHFDILKVPHHGSDRDFTADFFKSITATNYVISANGRYANPSEDVLDWIAAGAKKAYTLWLTNEGKTGYGDLEKNIKKAQSKQPSLKQNTHYRDAADLSVIVDLFEPLAI